MNLPILYITIHQSTPMEKYTTIRYEHQLAVYYGIHYPVEMANVVVEVLESSPKYTHLVRGECELKVGADTLCISTNSDKDSEITRGVIFVDEMTLQSDLDDSLSGAFLRINPRELVTTESLHTLAVQFLEGLLPAISRVVKAAGMSPVELYQGWGVLACTWEEEDESPPPTPKKTMPKIDSPKKSVSTPKKK